MTLDSRSLGRLMTALTHHTTTRVTRPVVSITYTHTQCSSLHEMGGHYDKCLSIVQQTTADPWDEDLFNISTSISATVDTILHTEAAPQLLLVLVARDPLQVAAAEAICPASIWAGLGWAGLGRNINLPQHTTHDAQPGPCMTRTRRENKCNPKLQIFFILLDIFSGPSLSLCARCGASLS